MRRQAAEPEAANYRILRFTPGHGPAGTAAASWCEIDRVEDSIVLVFGLVTSRCSGISVRYSIVRSHRYRFTRLPRTCILVLRGACQVARQTGEPAVIYDTPSLAGGSPKPSAEHQRTSTMLGQASALRNFLAHGDPLGQRTCRWGTHNC